MKSYIIGLGWLGLPLAKQLSSMGHKVVGTTRSIDKQKHLRMQQYDARLFDMFVSTPATQLVKANIEHSNVIINIAPGRKTIEVESYLEHMKQLIDYLCACQPKHITFISTTSVFGEQQGTLSEEHPTNASTASGVAHARIEKYLLSQCPDLCAILRLAGLIGPNHDGSLRHPVYALSKKSNIGNPNQRVNLIHQRDAIALICAIVDAQEIGQIFHGCSTDHPSRKDYYCWAAEKLNLKPLDFTPCDKAQTDSTSKIIDATATLNALNVDLAYPSPYDMLIKDIVSG